MKKKILIVASNYYNKITKNLISEAKKELKKRNYLITVKIVPGTFEIPVVISRNINKKNSCKIPKKEMLFSKEFITSQEV